MPTELAGQPPPPPGKAPTPKQALPVSGLTAVNRAHSHLEVGKWALKTSSEAQVRAATQPLGSQGPWLCGWGRWEVLDTFYLDFISFADKNGIFETRIQRILPSHEIHLSPRASTT